MTLFAGKYLADDSFVGQQTRDHWRERERERGKEGGERERGGERGGGERERGGREKEGERERGKMRRIYIHINLQCT